jgi:hypothetical protein
LIISVYTYICDNHVEWIEKESSDVESDDGISLGAVSSELVVDADEGIDAEEDHAQGYRPVQDANG